MRFRTVALGLVAVLATAGCSSGSKKAATPATIAPTTATVVSKTGDVNAAVLSLADFPSGWKSNPHKAATSNVVQQSIATCLHVPLAVVDTAQHKHADSDDFAGPAGVQVQSGVVEFASAAQARTAVDVYQQPTAAQCQRNAYTAQLKSSDITVTTEKAPRVGQGASAYTVTDKIAGVTAYAVSVQAQQGRFYAFVIYTALTPAVAQAAALVGKMTARLPDH